jgi:hypothetical protein
MSILKGRMNYLVIIAVAVILIGALGILFKRSRKTTEIFGWQKIESNTINQSDFLLSGDAVNYRDGRPYKLYLKNTGEKSLWYAEMQDTGEWYITDIGKQAD